MSKDELIRDLLEAGEHLKKELLLLVEAGQETGGAMLAELDAIDSWNNAVDKTDFNWQKKIVSDSTSVPPGLKNL